MDDFLVIGGGIAGVSAAARLAALGRVRVLEAETALGYHASGRSAALFEEAYGLPPTVALNRASHAEHVAREVLSPRGLMVVAQAGDSAAFEADVATMDLRPVSPSEARALVPILGPAVAFVAHSDAAQDIDTDRLMQSFAREARGNGTIVTGARVSAIARTGGGWAVETPAGPFEGRVLVNAAGAWADGVARMAGLAPLGFTPLRRSIARIAAPGGARHAGLADDVRGGRDLVRQARCGGAAGVAGRGGPQRTDGRLGRRHGAGRGAGAL